ncbi:MAG: histidine kinase [Prolixibacteraceae bacterium]|nr:histidine kinase [Prolixibacteraceae bacterium]
MISRLKNILISLAKNRALQHILFWAFSFLILVNILRVSAELKPIDIIYTLVFHVPLMLVVYVNLRVLVPRLLARKKYAWYAYAVIITIVIGAEFYLLLFDKWIDYLFPGFYFIAYYGFWDITLYLIVFLLLTTLIKLARAWFVVKQLEQENTENQLKVLRSQLNPHFLFNSLNNIYSLARKKDDATPGVILQLSDILRYVIYDADKDETDLKSEVEFIRKYVGLQQLRLQNKERVKMVIEGEIGNQRIAPLLFIPFIENSFKHGLPQTNEELIDINLVGRRESIYFRIKNNKEKSGFREKSKYRGVGMANVKKRLELLYNDRYRLEINDSKSTYEVKIEIRLTNENKN